MWRILRLFGSQPDLLISKPGIDVRGAGPGQLLLGRGVRIHQVVAQGQAVLAGPPVVPAGGSYAIAATPQTGDYTDLALWIKLYVLYQGQVYDFDGSGIGDYPASVRLINGVIYIWPTYYGPLGTANNPMSLNCRWAVFKYRYK